MGLEADFIAWFHSRGEYYAGLSVKYYMDGEPYFRSSMGAECSLRDYLRVRKQTEDVYTCRYISGGGTEYDGGLWRRKETDKTVRFTQIKESFYQPNWTDLKINKDVKKNKRHCYQDNEDGSYTVYPDQCGTPHIFEPIKPEKIEEVLKAIPTPAPPDR